MRKNIQTRIARAARIIRRGGLVVFPTETVYGIGANAFNPRAVRKIFHLKRRPADNPIIVHIRDSKELLTVARDISNDARLLMKEFWPGPLTLVFQKTKRVPKIVTGGLKTVAVRMPSHPVARALLRAAGVPIAAPSANLAGRPSGTRAAHVRDDFGRRTPFLLDAGGARFGVESTVLDVRGRYPILLREGAIPREHIEYELGRKVRSAPHTTKKPRSPGMKYRHYAPRVPLIVARDLNKVVERFTRRGVRVGSIRFKNNLESFAHSLFVDMRRLETKGVDLIIVEAVPRKGIGRAIMERLLKASQKT